MSHIRSDLDRDNWLYQSASASSLPPASAPHEPGIAGGVEPGWRLALRALAATLRTWRARRRARRELAAIDARTLRDIGIAPELVEYEISQPFWRPLRDWRE
jgi:uncharacterized protein YjiS (DUF1127 family)